MLKQLPMTARLNNAGSVNRNLQRPEKNSYCRTRESSVCILGNWHQLVSVQQFFNSSSFSETIMSWWLGWFAIAWLTSLVFVMLHAKRLMLYSPFWQLSVIGHILTNKLLRCWADGGFEKLKRVRRRFFLVSPSSLLSHTAIPLFAMTKHSSKPGV